ncbi:hypothetical protein EW146_g10026 [Bondarzewia mesenterica]|uniref:Uncharacterized protein n=1 Tax=Bondarzewia mesenterica TaxID=1095465 RepID=A0A4S4L130_9AGAM|nr:hypothetical protein EW146_g10026 [Bondarzewia mesenterica]
MSSPKHTTPKPLVMTEHEKMPLFLPSPSTYQSLIDALPTPTPLSPLSPISFLLISMSPNPEQKDGDDNVRNVAHPVLVPICDLNLL